ncbi:MAG: hypothetical protein U0441_27355 [Polyangiaceae bacterium]
MGKLEHGNVVVSFANKITIPEKAGHLSAAEAARIPRARKGVGLACDATSTALEKYGDRVPGAGDAGELAKAGEMADAIDEVIADVEHLLMILKQANLLLDGDAHTRLRRALTAVRAAEKFDPKVADLFRGLIAYFARSNGEAASPAEGADTSAKPA